MYRNFLSRHFNEEELQIIDWAVELIRSEDSINVNMAFGGLNTIGLLRRLLSVLEEYYKEVTFLFEKDPSNSKPTLPSAKYIIILYKIYSEHLPNSDIVDLTFREKGLLIYSFENSLGDSRNNLAYFAEGWRNNRDLGLKYENIPIPIFAEELSIYGHSVNKLSLFKYELFNIPVSRCYLELGGNTPIELPYLNLKSNLLLQLEDCVHMKSVFDNLLRYPDLKKLSIITFFAEVVSFGNMVSHFHLPNNIREFELFVKFPSEFEISKNFIEKLIFSNLTSIKLHLYTYDKLPDTIISTLNNYNFHWEGDSVYSVYSLHRNI